MQEKMKELREAESKLLAILRDIKSDVCEAVNRQKFDGKIISEKPLAFTMKLSQLDKRCWAPDYYAPCAQADAVQSLLDRCSTIKQFEQAVKSMLERRYVNIGNSRVMLNDRTIEAIQKSFVKEG